MTVLTLGDLTTRTGRTVYDHLDLDDPLVVLDGLQAQGDLTVLPVEVARRNGAAVAAKAEWVEVPAAGVVVLAGTHDHVLVADPGTCRWTTQVGDSTGLALGALDCAAPVWLLHAEHGATGLAPGRYVLRATREQADEIRRVAD